METHLKWGYRKLRAEAVAGQAIIISHIKDEIRKEGLLLSIDEYRPTRHMGTKEERIHAALKPRYENGSVWHYYGGHCEDLEQELIQYNPPNDDIKDALESVMGIIRPPIETRRFTQEPKVVSHPRFGGVAM